MKRKEPERTVRIVYIIERKSDGVAVYAAVTRSLARKMLNCYPDGKRHNHSVVRCEVVETKRKGGGA